ncbi:MULTISPECIES: GerMN domain-containing protein [Paenibacillus]|uniref:GerMN domain-containing protein n=1 Tax=Paenibacillus lignilyticus TaxID=1172615 RepID=A0ABS5C628_9BACL|nr:MULTISPECIES: GerMN domain-containing protein [Paenibacillus]MBP3961449.1 GerMN domain-containing protein [Paenibacillus lignilyticus]SFS58094.1 germination protein M [Paenibacillus sp. BC26]
MTYNRLLRRAALAGVLALPILTTGCGLFSQPASESIDPPQNSTQNVDADLNAGQTVTEGDQSQMTLYLKDRNGLLAPVTVMATLGPDEKLGQKALEMMVEGGAYESEIPDGFEAVLPKGTTVKGLNIVPDQKLAVVDFTKSFADYNVSDERKIVEAITWTLTSLEGVQNVEIDLEGQKLSEMPQDGLPIDDQLTRAVGINLEAADNVDYSQSTPVTIYFSAVTPDNVQYYVPVTRLVTRSNNKAKTAIEQLISGPLNDLPLKAVMTPDVLVKNVTKKNDVVTVELQDDSYQQGQQEPAEMLQAVVLALTENTGMSKVQIKLNGKTDFVDTNNQSYSEPVSRPEHVNAFKS